jgi:hypothetical protein
VGVGALAKKQDRIEDHLKAIAILREHSLHGIGVIVGGCWAKSGEPPRSGVGEEKEGRREGKEGGEAMKVGSGRGTDDDNDDDDGDNEDEEGVGHVSSAD